MLVKVRNTKNQRDEYINLIHIVTIQQGYSSSSYIIHMSNGQEIAVNTLEGICDV